MPYFRFAADMLSCIVGQLHAFAPFLVDVHLALRQFHYDVGGLESGIIRQIGADAEGAADFAPAMLLDVECLAKIERIAEDDGFSGRVDAQFAVAGNELVGEIEFIAGVAAYTVE